MEEESLKRKSEWDQSNFPSPPKINCSQDISVRPNTENKENFIEKNNESQVIVNTGKEAEQRATNQTEDVIEKDNLKSDRDKIRRRRSSYGRYLTKQTSCSSPSANSEVSEQIGEENLRNVHLSTQQPRGYNLEENISNNNVQNVMETKPNCTEQKEVESKIVSSKIKLYQEKSKKLEVEYKTWKNLLSSRKRRTQEAQRELREAKSGETLIEEEVLSHLNREQRIILLCRPNYNEYLQKIKHAKEEIILINLEVQRVLTSCQSFSKLAKLASQRCIQMIEQSFHPSMKKDPKALLQALIK